MQEEGVAGWARKTAGLRVNPASDPSHHEWYIQQMSQTSQRVVLETLAYLATQDLTSILPQIQTPTLILASEQSVASNPDRTEGMNRLLPNSRIKSMPGTSGYIQHSEPEKCVSAWREFVGELSHS